MIAAAGASTPFGAGQACCLEYRQHDPDATQHPAPGPVPLTRMKQTPRICEWSRVLCWAFSLEGLYHVQPEPAGVSSWPLLGAQVWNYKLPLAKLDMRCWTGPDKDIPLPGPVRQCLQHFANSTPNNLQVELGLVRPEFAFSLKERAEVRPLCCPCIRPQ